MNPMLKKIVAAVAVKEAIEKVQEMRKPKPSLWSRISPLVFVAAIGGALFYLGKSGKLGGMKDKSVGSGGSSNGSTSWDGGSNSAAPAAPSPSTSGV